MADQFETSCVQNIQNLTYIFYVTIHKRHWLMTSKIMPVTVHLKSKMGFKI